MYPTQDTSRMGTVMLKQEEGDTGIIAKEKQEIWKENERGYEGGKCQTRPDNSTDVLTSILRRM